MPRRTPVSRVDRRHRCTPHGAGAMSRILAFGASGPIAGLVLPELVRRGADVRAFVRRDDQREPVLGRGASEVAVGDLNDARGVGEALSGVEAVFYIAPVDLPDQAAIGRRLVAQAVDAGVKRFVFSSVIHPVLGSLPNHAAKAPVEEAIIDSGLEFAILHPAVLYQNFAAAWRDITTERLLAEPWSNETRHSRVDYRDVAEVAAIALIEDRLTNGTFELCAEGKLDRRDIAAMLADVTGHEVEARRIDPATLEPEADALRPMFDHYDRHGLHGNALTLRAILGREARSLREYFEDLANGRC